MKSKKLTVKQKNKRTIDILAACISILLALIVAASVVLGVGFGKYGSNTDNWFKPGTSKPDEVLPTPIAIGDKISFTADGEGLPLYLNTSDEAVAAIDAKVEEIKTNFPQYDDAGYMLTLGVFCSYELPADANANEFSVPDGEKLYVLNLLVAREGYLLALMWGEDNIVLYAHVIEADDDGPEEGFQNIDTNGRVVFDGDAASRDYYVCDRNFVANTWFQPADDDFVNMILSTTPFVKA